MNIAIVASKGGHLGQMKLIFEDKILKKHKAILVTESEKELGKKPNSFLSKYNTYFFPKDSLGFNILRYFYSIARLKKIFEKEKIEIIFTNGAQISIPAILAGRILGIKTVFIETVIRVKTPTWTGRVCYLFSDIFLVQHENMIRKYGRKSQYIGGIV